MRIGYCTYFYPQPPKGGFGVCNYANYATAKSPLGDLGVIKIFLVGLLLCLLPACREDVEVFEPETVVVSVPEYTSIQGFYLLNEGNMGSNKSTLDYYDYETGEYHRNIFSAANPSVVKELGDVGNDVKIYGSKLYAVINCSNKIEVMDAQTAKRLGQIDIPNCRYIHFHGA
jgi:hypothetical protein